MRRPVVTLTVLAVLALAVTALLAPSASGRTTAFKTIRGKGVTIAAPATWKKGPSSGAIRLSASAPAPAGSSPTNVIVLSGPRGKATAAKVRPLLPAFYKQLGVRATLLRSRSVRLPVGRALELVYRGRVTGRGLNLRWIAYLIERPTRFYVVTLGATAARYPSMLPTFRKMAQSFRITA